MDDDGDDEDKDVILLCSNPDRQWSLIVMDRPGRTAFEDTLGWLFNTTDSDEKNMTGETLTKENLARA